MLLVVLLLAIMCALQGYALSSKHLSCQLIKPSGISPLQGCPLDTIFVSSTDLFAKFKSVQEAIQSL